LYAGNRRGQLEKLINKARKEKKEGKEKGSSDKCVVS
jgi:hypothetical protein